MVNVNNFIFYDMIIMLLESYPEELLNVDFLSSKLYNFLKTKDSKLILPAINYKNIDITDIKLVLNNDYQNLIINNIFNTKIEFNHRKLGKYVFKRVSDTLSTDISLTVYSDDKNNITAHENSNALITWILGDLVIRGVTKGIILNIMVVDIKISLLKPFIELQPVLSEFLDSKYDNMFFQCTVLEHFYKKCYLANRLHKMSKKEILSVILQVSLILDKIHQIYPTFRHNKLTVDSVIFYLKKPELIDVKFENETKQISDHGFEVKITDFDNSIIIGLTDNSSLLPEKKIPNLTYDILYLLKNINNTNIINLNSIMEKIQNNFSASNVIMSEYFIIGEEIEQDGGAKKKLKQKKAKVIKGKRKLAGHKQKSLSIKRNESDDEHEYKGYKKDMEFDDSFSFTDTPKKNNQIKRFAPDEENPIQQDVMSQMARFMPPIDNNLPLTAVHQQMAQQGYNNMTQSIPTMPTMPIPAMQNQMFSPQQNLHMRTPMQMGGDDGGYESSDDEFLDLTEEQPRNNFFFRP